MTSTKTFKLELIPELNIDNDHVNNIGVKLYRVDNDGFETQLLYAGFKDAVERLLQIIEMMEDE